MVDGGTSVIETGVDAATAPARLARHVLDGPSSLGVAIGHAGREARPGADALARLLEDAPAVRTVSRYRVGPSVGAHTGPGAFGCFWWPAAGASPETYLD